MPMPRQQKLTVSSSAAHPHPEIRRQSRLVPCRAPLYLSLERHEVRFKLFSTKSEETDDPGAAGSDVVLADTGTRTFHVDFPILFWHNDLSRTGRTRDLALGAPGAA